MSNSLDEVWTKLTLECQREGLLAPLGLRTHAVASPEYAGRYDGSPLQRDGAYHEGLRGPVVESWFARARRTTGVPDAARLYVAVRFLGHVNQSEFINLT